MEESSRAFAELAFPSKEQQPAAQTTGERVTPLYPTEFVYLFIQFAYLLWRALVIASRVPAIGGQGTGECVTPPYL